MIRCENSNFTITVENPLQRSCNGHATVMQRSGSVAWVLHGCCMGVARVQRSKNAEMTNTNGVLAKSVYINKQCYVNTRRVLHCCSANGGDIRHVLFSW